jgi:hypothetical protein
MQQTIYKEYIVDLKKLNFKNKFKAKNYKLKYGNPGINKIKIIN